MTEVVNVDSRQTVLLTGARGQLGSLVQGELHRRGYRVVCLSTSQPGNSTSADRWITWDLSASLVPPMLDEPVHVLIHLGAQTSAYVARKSPKADLFTNAARFVALLESLVRSGESPFVIFAGTATQAGSSANNITDETAVHPETFYDVAKTVSELYLEQFVRENWLTGVSLRFSNVYGQIPSLEAHRGVLASSVVKALRGEPLTFYPECDGKRDYLHVEDAARAILATIVRRDSLTREAYWVGSGASHALGEAFNLVLEIVQAVSNTESKVVAVPAPAELYPIERRSVCVNSATFRVDTGWSPQLSLRQGIERMVSSILADGLATARRSEGMP